MTTLIAKIDKLIKKERTTPERKNDDATKSSNEILSELFSVFNADPPKIEDITIKKSKKVKKKHKKEKKKRSRSVSSFSSDDNDYSHKRKKRKKSKIKRKDKSSRRSPSDDGSRTPDIKQETDTSRSKYKNDSEIATPKIKEENKINIALKETKINIKSEQQKPAVNSFDASLIPMPQSPLIAIDIQKLEKKVEPVTDCDKTKSKIQIKNLKFSAVFEETVKKAEEEARKRAEKVEDGECTDSSSSSIKDMESNSQFPKTSDPGGILKKQAAEEIKQIEEEKHMHKKSKSTETNHKSSKRERSRSKKRSRSRSRRSRSRSATKRRKHRSTSRTRRRSGSRHRTQSRSKRRSKSRDRSRHRSRHGSPRYRSRRSRSPSGVKLADSEKKRLLEVARRNAINMLKNGAVPAGAAALPPHTRNQVMAAIQSGGKSVDELTDFCKHLSKKEALGELSSVSSNDDNMSENEDTLAFHHPFLVKEKAPIVMNIRGGAPLPVKSSLVPIANKEELRLQFPVSSGSQHREKASEWVPVSPKKDMQVAKVNSKPPTKTTPAPVEAPVSEPLALPAPVSSPPPYLKEFTSGSQLSTVPALPAPGPQAYPPGVENSNMDLEAVVSQKLSMIRQEQEENELCATRGFGWSSKELGQFTGSTGAQILTPKELASGTQAWAKKDQLVRAAPVEGGMGMHLLQKMGWTPGQGLGKEGTGTLQPLLLEVKLDTRGLQSKEEVRTRPVKGWQVPIAGPERALATPSRLVGMVDARCCQVVVQHLVFGWQVACCSIQPQQMRPESPQIKPQRPSRRGPAPLIAGGKHPVSLLGEYCSKQKLGPPEYNLCFECGPDHKKNFLFKVKVAGVEYQPAVASANKKQAKADAAHLALHKLGIVIQ